MHGHGKLFCILGKSGAGKDTVFEALLQDASLSLRPVVAYTTRPRREFERDGREYHFVTEAAFARLRAAGKIIEERSYDTVRGVWRYATVDDGEVDFSLGSYLMIATLEALPGLRARFGAQVVPFYLAVEDGLRLRRMLRRESRRQKPDYEEVCRRFLADNRDFSPSMLQKAGVSDRVENRRLSACLRCIRERIRAQTEPIPGGLYD